MTNNNERVWRWLRIGLLLACAWTASGCVSAPYKVGTGRMDQDIELSPPMREQFLFGKPNTVLDAADWYWPYSLAGKLILWNKNIDSHQISPETIDVLKAYVQENDLRSLQVIVNGYYPGNQWQRLFKNRAVGGGWRYTLGIVSVVGYTIMPGRFFGGDAYNPFTNTLYLYSDEPAIALHEGGHAKDFGSREYKGTHAALYQLPFVSLYYEGVATSEALSYVHCRNTTLEKEAYNLLYPAWTTYVSGNIGRFSADPAWMLAVIPGHIVGRTMSANVEPCPTSDVAMPIGSPTGVQ